MSYAWAYAISRMDLAPAVIGNGCLIKRVFPFHALPAVERAIRRGVSGKRWLGVARLEWPYQYGVLLRSSPIARECVAKGYHGLYGDLYIKREVLSSETLVTLEETVYSSRLAGTSR